MPETPRLQTRIDGAVVDQGRARCAALLGHRINIAHLARAGMVAIARGYVADEDLKACLEAAELVPGPTGPRMRSETADG
jgi:hypothetical protein